MTRRRLLVLLALLAGWSPVAADDGDAPRKAPTVAWFDDIPTARAAATKLGRPIWIALHPRIAEADAKWPLRVALWKTVYGDAALVAKSRGFACVLRMVGGPPIPVAPRPEDSTVDMRPRAPQPLQGPMHLIVDATGTRLLARQDDWRAAPGQDSVDALLTLLDLGARRADPVPPDSPEIGHALVRATPPARQGGDPANALPVGEDMPGLEVDLRWDLPLPKLVDGNEGEKLYARVTMYWDGSGPFDVGNVMLTPGEEVDEKVVVRFDAYEELQPLRTKGRHRLDFYIRPEPGSFKFSDGPLHVGLLWIETGDGGGGGGGGDDNSNKPPDQPQPQDQEEEKKEDETQPTPQPQTPPDPPPEIPDDELDIEVIDPFVREGDMIKKDDAIVAVPDDDAGVKPPKRVPLEDALRDFEKVLQRAVDWESYSPRMRDFLRRYFEEMRRRAGGAK